MPPPSKEKEKPVEFATVLSQVESGTIAPVYLLYGEDVVALNLAKRNLINQLIPAEFRDGNLTEFNGKNLDVFEVITLSDTYPFLASRRVIIIENYPFLGGTKKLSAKATADLERFAEYFNEQQANWTVFVFSFEEDKEKGKTVAKTNPLFTAIKKRGVIIEFPFSGSMFKFLDALGERNSALALAYVTQLFRSELDKTEPIGIHRMISRYVRFWLQALLHATEAPDEWLPESATLNLKQQKPFVQSKIERQARNFSRQKLIDAVAELVELEDKLNPRATDILGEDPELLLESWIIKFCD
ncbi:MAG: hypothetical protein N3A72_07800 [bacterium]|nr:hypothetical protein [bacterium]